MTRIIAGALAGAFFMYFFAEGVPPHVRTILQYILMGSALGACLLILAMIYWAFDERRQFAEQQETLRMETKRQLDDERARLGQLEDKIRNELSAKREAWNEERAHLVSKVKFLEESLHKKWGVHLKNIEEENPGRAARERKSMEKRLK
jgi:uncharacterized protein YPO0396